MYLDSFVFPDEDWEWNARLAEKRTCYNTMYPMGVLSGIGLERLDFAPITILYGGNGTGKTTALNVMAAKLGLLRDTLGNSSTFMEAYVRACRANLEEDIPAHSRMVTSDDVFDYMLNLRELNTHIDQEREKLFQEHTQARHTVFQLRNLDDYEELKKRNSARRKTQSAFVREQLGGNVREMSNGESALFYFKQRLEEDALYLLDEPENSLSPRLQLELRQFLEDSARFYRCQLIIATHSPFLLSLRGAKIYDLDGDKVEVRPWTQLPHVRAYYEFFRERQREFEA